MLIIVSTASSLFNLNTDPSLLSYFSPKTEIYHGLNYIDKNGGSSPLILIINDINNKTLNTKKIYKRLLGLQESLEKHPDVGTVISLPTLISEGRKVPFSFPFYHQKHCFLKWSLKNTTK